jgi:hypothetical protein
MHESHILTALGFLAAFVASGGLLGYMRFKHEARKAPADRALAIWQRREIQARIRRDDESAAVTGLKELAEGLKADRNYWKDRAEKAERRWLEEELGRLPEPPSDGN